VATEMFESHGKKLPWEIFRPPGEGKQPGRCSRPWHRRDERPLWQGQSDRSPGMSRAAATLSFCHTISLEPTTPAGLAALKTFIQNHEAWVDALCDAVVCRNRQERR